MRTDSRQPRPLWHCPIVILFVCLIGRFVAAVPALADEVLFNNGDRLTGEVLSVEGGKMKLKTATVGEVTVDMKDVRTFTTVKPVELRTTGGERITAPVVGGADAGTVRVQPAEGDDAEAAARDVSFDEIKYVNFSEKWTGAVVAGAQFARGNTYANQANVSFDLTRRTEEDRWTFTGGYNFSRERDPDSGDRNTTTDNVYLTGKYDYFFTEKFYGFASFRGERDRIADLDYRLIPGVGVGYLWIDRPDLKFDTEAGLAYVYERFEDGDTNDSVSARLAYHLKRNLWDDKVALFHNLEYYPSFEDPADDFLVVTDAGVRASMTERMFAEYKIEYRYDATPAEGLGESDLRHLVGVGWKF